MYSYYNSSYTEDLTDLMVVGCIIGLLISFVFGCITLSINENKGYEGGFAWGFWLGIIGIIVVACKPTYVPAEMYSSEKASGGLGRGSWKCSCGRYNANDISSCICGRSKDDLLQGQEEQQKAIPSGNTEVLKKVEALKKYKELLDQEVITQEEFDVLKKTILMQ